MELFSDNRLDIDQALSPTLRNGAQIKGMNFIANFGEGLCPR